ncbi:unnamed protein product [Durusdinium trenchii]|uniref:K Homology domain-containing protein n=1 Tax=Durusdinium trenchii TaxID=1381693 RepID=A0ABP0N1M9_9DINO
MDITLRLSLPRAVAACVLGVKGATKRELENLTGVFAEVKLEDGSLQLSGSTAQVEAAQQLLTERVHFQQFEVPRDAARAILGERGSVRHEIEATTGAHLWVELREQTALVQVAGNVSAVERAITTLDFKVVQDCLLQPLFAERWLRQVARRLRELLAAEGKSSQCRISVERMEDRVEMKLIGHREVVATAKVLAQDEVVIEEVPLSKADALRLLQASQLKALRQMTGATIEVSVVPSVLRLAGNRGMLEIIKKELGKAVTPVIAADAIQATSKPPEMVPNPLPVKPANAVPEEKPRILIDGMDVLHFCNTPSAPSAPAAAWDQLRAAAEQLRAGDGALRIFLPEKLLTEAPADLQTCLVKAEDPKSYILSAAEVLIQSGKKCLIVSNGTGASYNQENISRS